MGIFSRPRIAIVEMTGLLSGGPRGNLCLRMLQGLRESRRVRAVVVDIDSPGGAVAISDYLHQTIAKLAAQKPVVAFIRGMGASGGYLAGCAATRIVALSSALVGSIGVISIHPTMPELLQKLGIRVGVSKGGRLKDMGAFWREATEEEKQKEQELVNEFYESFIQTVARSRKLSPEQVRECATGEVFTARRAKELGLVDELGDLDRALDLAAELGKVPRRSFYLRPRRPFLERLISPMVSSLAQTVREELERPFQIYYLG